MDIFIAYATKHGLRNQNEFWLWACETINDPPSLRECWADPSRGLFITTFTSSQSSLLLTQSMTPSSVVCAGLQLLALKKAKEQNLLCFSELGIWWHFLPIVMIAAKMHEKFQEEVNRETVTVSVSSLSCSKRWHTKSNSPCGTQSTY